MEPPTPTPTFEETLARLEEIVETLGSEATTLEHALATYEEGWRLARACMDRLSAAELRVRELTTE
ncbi:MAG: exodeoxyribonuclease VII small subunit [Bacteroidota bacterium]